MFLLLREREMLLALSAVSAVSNGNDDCVACLKAGSWEAYWEKKC